MPSRAYRLSRMPALFGDASTEEIGGWRPEPLQRGTFSILSSCIVTMTLCVWTSVHLNIPEHGEAHHVKWRKLWWLLIALFAPELVSALIRCKLLFRMFADHFMVLIGCLGCMVSV